MNKTTFDICVLPGDGIGVDVIEATLPLLARLASAGHRLCLPVMAGRGLPLVFRSWTPGDQTSAAFGPEAMGQTQAWHSLAHRWAFFFLVLLVVLLVEPHHLRRVVVFFCHSVIAVVFIGFASLAVAAALIDILSFRN